VGRLWQPAGSPDVFAVAGFEVFRAESSGAGTGRSRLELSIYLKKKRELFDRLLAASEKLFDAVDRDDEEGIVRFQTERHEIIQNLKGLDGESANIPAPEGSRELEEIGDLKRVIGETVALNERIETTVLGRVRGVTADRRRNRVARAYARADALRG